MITDLTHDTYGEILSRSPFVPRLNLVFDAYGKRKFTYLIDEGKQKKYATLFKGEEIDDLYQKLLDIISGGQEQKNVEEDNELILNPDGTGCIFQGIPLIYENRDEITKVVEKVEKVEEKKRRSLKENAKTSELVEEDEEDKAKEGENAPPAEPEQNQDKNDENAPEEEKKKDPLNTFVFAFWNPRHKLFEDKVKQFLHLADPEEIKKLRQQNHEEPEPQPEPVAEGEKKKAPPKEETRPYLKLFTCI